MKRSHLIFACLCVQSTLMLSADEPSKVINPSQAAEFARQANAKLEEASSPQDFQAAAGLLEESAQLDPG